MALSDTPPLFSAFDLVVVGTPMVDIKSDCDESFLQDHSISKSSRQLITQERAQFLHSFIKNGKEVLGGSGPNSVHAYALLGGKVGFLGKIADDTIGHRYAKKLRDLGVDFDTQPLQNGPSTALCLIFNTPDGERSMNTYLGAGSYFNKADIDHDKIKQSKIMYIEGYLWKDSCTKEAVLHAIDIAQNYGVKIALSLSDPAAAIAFRIDFLKLIDAGKIDILLGNELEAQELYGGLEFADIILRLQSTVNISSCITKGKQGAVIIGKNSVEHIDSMPVSKVIDTTGAGDVFAAGFLYGFNSGLSLLESGKLAAICASLIIEQKDSQFEGDLQEAVLSSRWGQEIPSLQQLWKKAPPIYQAS